MGIASNCSREYLDVAMANQGLGEFIGEARCLDSPGVNCKADMIEDLLLSFGTRSAVMVGDRAVDGDAAHRNGLPHVHLSSGFAPPGESIHCEAVIEDFLALLPRLEGRNRWIESALSELGIGAVTAGPASLGITGRSGAGKSLFARDVARFLEGRGREVKVVCLDDYLRSDAPAVAGRLGEPLDHLTRAFDIDSLVREVLEPHARGAARSGALLVLEGLFLAHPRLRPHLARLIHLEVPDELCLSRISARELPLGGGEEVRRTRRFFLPAQEAFEEAYPPASRADLVLPGANPLGPE